MIIISLKTTAENMLKKDNIKDELDADIQRNKSAVLEMNAVNNETDNTSKQSSKEFMKTPVTEMEHYKLENRQLQIESPDYTKKKKKNKIKINKIKQNIIREIVKVTNADLKDRNSKKIAK